MSRIIQRDRSIIPACDVDIIKFEEIVKATADIEAVGAYKIGPALAGRPGYDKIVNIRSNYINKPLIWDAQKWGTDIPDTAGPMLTPVKEAGIDAVILFPESGPVTEYKWIKTAQDLGLGVIVGGEMTHPGYMEGDVLKEEHRKIFEKLGINDFIVPGNKPDRITHYKEIIEGCGISGAVFYSPGLVAQGGDISEGAKAAGNYFHGIVGRGITKAENIREAALELTSKL